MAELIDIYDANRKHIGVADRNVAHTFGLWHRSLHCWIVLSDGRLVFQRRSEKAGNSGKLYTTASGHLSAGETLEASFAREVKEEVGIDICFSCAKPLYLDGLFIFDKIKPDGSVFIDRVFSNTFAAKFDGELTDFKFEDGEVDAVAAVNPRDYLKLCNGEVDKIPGTIFDGKTQKETEFTANDFLLVGADTLYSKFGTICEKVIKQFA